ncbi:MAG: Eco57I restriction-modification methylase domain-containing protein, partial [Caulobacteraceae bacterium]
MGSGHFLVAAVDRIEKGFTDYLATEGASGAGGVRAELARLKGAAQKQLGELADAMAFEDSQLLRRLIARRCIYGVDLNPLSVELARLAMWIHTFVPGLPLSVLDHNLVNGDALVGVGTIAEIREAFEASSSLLFPVDADNLLGQAERSLRRFANLADASLSDVGAARSALEEAKVRVGDTRTLCDIIAASRLDPSVRYQFENWEKDRARIGSHPARHKALEALAGLRAFHFPVAFPEVFLRRRSGFDVILGNPPWQEATIEDHAFWARHFPGLRGLPQTELERERTRLRRSRPDLAAQLDAEIAEAAKVRKALTSGAYPGMGTGDPDLYKAFLWRFWNLSADEGGRIGVVLPRSAFAAKGSELFRKALFAQAAIVDLTMLLNNRRWVFDEVHPQYTIGLAAMACGRREGESIALRGPYANLAAFEAGHDGEGARFTGEEVLSWNDSASLPLLPTADSLGVFTQLRKAPRLDLDDGVSWRARPDAELHATAQKPLMDFAERPPKSYWPVFKGESFDLWEPDRGPKTYYAWADPDLVADWLYAKRLRASRGGAQSEFSAAWRRDRNSLACYAPRIAFRDVSRSTDSRTVRAALLPPDVFITNKGPYFLWPRGNEQDQAFLLGMLSSHPLDWYSRRFVEVNLNFFIFNPFPIPRPPREDPLWRRAVALAGRLAAPDERFADWAAKV